MNQYNFFAVMNLTVNENRWCISEAKDRREIKRADIEI